MKKNKLNRKLSLNKQEISRLNLDEIKGGVLTDLCITLNFKCLTILGMCPETNPELCNDNTSSIC